MTDIESIKANIEDQWLNYTDEVRAVARQIFETEVKPFCQRYGYEFTAAGGNWWIGPPSSKIGAWTLSSFDRHPSPELQPLHDLLSLWVPGLQASLGSLMPGYKPGSREAEK